MRLPFSLGVEFDALYKRFGYDQEWNLIGARTTFRTTVNAWEFPPLRKFRFESPLNPFLAGGISYPTAPMELVDRNASGEVFAAGFELPVPKVRVAPEVRFTHWSGDQIRERNGLSAQ